MLSADKPCTFGTKCKDKQAGRPCPAWHFKCKFGKDCKHRATCPLEHDDSQSLNKPAKRLPISEVECKFGNKCFKRAKGECPFKHSG